jgi:hypothetical protein
MTYQADLVGRPPIRIKTEPKPPVEREALHRVIDASGRCIVRVLSGISNVGEPHYDDINLGEPAPWEASQ